MKISEISALVPVENTGNALSRRRFIGVSALSIAGAVLSGCNLSPLDAAPTEQVKDKAKPAVAGAVAIGAFGAQAVGNRAPLQSAPLHALPLGSVRASGWLLTQLELQRDGLTGHAEEVLPDVGPNSAWLGGDGEAWEKGPYYLKGLIPLAYTLDDAELKAKAQKWVDAILNSQREDGFFGPKSNDDWWPRMVATYVIRDYGEATGDARVVPFLTKYHRHMNDHLDARQLRDWGKSRAGDQIDTVFWNYNRTGDAFLLELADKLAKQAYPWRDIQINNKFLEFGEDFQPKHSVNVPQALKMPIVYSQRSKNPDDVAAYAAGVANLNRDHGLSAGINSGTEFLAGRSTTQGIETCSIVERMLSDETAIRVAGNAAIGDDLETMAFNVLPAALSTSIHQHVYYTLPNNVTAPRGGAGFNQDYDNGRTPAPISGFPCCCYNFHMGWPKFAQNSWAATDDGGLAVIAYAPTTATAPVGARNTSVTWTQTTNYPFDDTVTLTLKAPANARFPLKLRVPGWCENAEIKVNGGAQPQAKAGTFAVLNREWKNGDVVTARFPMVVRTLSGVNNSVSVRRGPLIYSLKIAENWQVKEKGKVEGFDAYIVTPDSPWNYALALSGNAGDFQFAGQKMSGNPFDPKMVPVKMTVRARRLPDWTLAQNEVVAHDPPVGPVSSGEPIETITLVPFGSQMLRVTDFPVLGTPPTYAQTFKDDFQNGHFDAFVPYGGGWFVENAALHAASNAGSGSYGLAGVKCVALQTKFDNFSYEGEVSPGPVGNAGLIFRVNKPGIGGDSYQGYYVGISAERNEVELGRSNNDWNSLGVAKMNFEADKPVLMRVEARGSNIKVWVGNMNAPLIEANDAMFSSGAVGVRHYAGDAAKTRGSWANLNVKSL